jgi:hypothetical protein
MNLAKVFFLGAFAIIFVVACREESIRTTNKAVTEKVASIEPCSLLTNEDIASVLRVQVSDAKPRGTPRPNCEYAVGDGSVTVFVFTDPSAAGAFEAGKTMQDAHTDPVLDIGDQAYWSPEIKTLNVLKGKVYFTVQFYGVPSGSKETMTALAQIAAKRLP